MTAYAREGKQRERWAGMHLLHREVDPNAAADLPSGGRMIMTTVMMMIIMLTIIIITVVVIIMITMIVIIITVVIIMITMIVIIITTVVAVRAFRTLMCAHVPSITDHSCMRHAPVKHLGAVQWNVALFQRRQCG